MRHMNLRVIKFHVWSAPSNNKPNKSYCYKIVGMCVDQNFFIAIKVEDETLLIIKFFYAHKDFEGNCNKIKKYLIMKLIRKANNKKSFSIARSEWLKIGKDMGWLTSEVAEQNNAPSGDTGTNPQPPQPPADVDPASSLNEDELLYALEQGTLNESLTSKLSGDESNIFNSIRGKLAPIFTNPQWMQDQKSKSAIYHMLSTFSPSEIQKLKGIAATIQEKSMENLKKKQ